MVSVTHYLWLRICTAVIPLIFLGSDQWTSVVTITKVSIDFDSIFEKNRDLDFNVIFFRG